MPDMHQPVPPERRLPESLSHDSWPPLNLDHLRRLTDETGIIQHAVYSIPDLATGYTTDDNARALLVACQDFERCQDPWALRGMAVYLAFLHHALTPDGYFHNLMSYDRRWIDARGSEDSHGRALWATGYAATAAVPEEIRRAARQIFEEALPWAPRLRSPRAIAFSLLGVCARAREEAPFLAGLPERLGDHLVALHRRYRGADWEWFEESLTYSNAMLPLALLHAHALTGEERYRLVAQTTLGFLAGVTVADGILQPVGCHGWYTRGGTRAWFDQQPVDAAGMVLLLLNAWQMLGDARCRALAELSFEWFFGRNALRQSMVSPATGACHDGLMAEGVNGNQGAEAQVAYLLAYLAMARAGLADPAGSPE